MSQLHSAPAAATPRERPGAMSLDLRRAAQAYAEHLLAGGVATWPAFLARSRTRAGHEGARTAPVPQHEPPGATQAELLRRLNRRVRPAAVDRDLAERVLGRAAPGRGRVDLRLTDPPERVPVTELLRVAAGVLADLVAELPQEAARPQPASIEPVRRRAPAYRLEGPPVTVSALRRRLVAAGLPPRGGRRWRLRRRPEVVLVVALPLRRALFEVWSRRVQRGGTKSWPGLLAEWRAGRLPPAAGYDRLAAGWASRIGASRVHVVTADDLDGQVAAVLGRPVATAGPGGHGTAALTPVAVEVVRRTSEVLTFRVPPEEKQQRLGSLVALLADPPGEPSRRAPGTPPGHVGWLRLSGQRTAARLSAGGYAVHGSLSSLGRTGAPARPTLAWDRAVLAAMLRAVLRVDDLRSRAGAGRGAGA